MCTDPVNDYGYCAFASTSKYPEDFPPFIVLAHGDFWVCGKAFRAAAPSQTRAQYTALSGPFDNIGLAAIALQLEE